MKQCPQCGVPAADGNRFCKECGYQFTQVAACPQCGAPLAGGVAFCEQCGCNVVAAQAAPGNASQPPAPSPMMPPPGNMATPPSQAPYQAQPQQEPHPYPGYPPPANRGGSSAGKVAIFFAVLGVLLAGAGWAVYTGMGGGFFGKSIGTSQEQIENESSKSTPQPAIENNNAVEESSNLDNSLEEDVIYTSVEQPPTFPGGEAALMNHIGSQIQYPIMAQENNVQGRVVVKFVVEKDGHVGEVMVVSSVDKDLDNEACRVCKTLPNFIPGYQDGQPVRVWYTLPINFKLQDKVDSSPNNT